MVALGGAGGGVGKGEISCGTGVSAGGGVGPKVEVTWRNWEPSWWGIVESPDAEGVWSARAGVFEGCTHWAGIGASVGDGIEVMGAFEGCTYWAVIGASAGGGFVVIWVGEGSGSMVVSVGGTVVGRGEYRMGRRPWPRVAIVTEAPKTSGPPVVRLRRAHSWARGRIEVLAQESNSAVVVAPEPGG